jgi:hypothetical protein
MQISFGSGPGQNPTLREAGNFHSFSVSVTLPPDGGRVDALRALEQIGRVETNDHVYVPASVIRQLAGPATGEPGWEESLLGMVEYAARRGWVDDDGALRAHIEWRIATDNGGIRSEGRSS